MFILSHITHFEWRIQPLVRLISGVHQIHYRVCALFGRLETGDYDCIAAHFIDMPQPDNVKGDHFASFVEETTF
jgi:hypothetical protein